MYFFQAVANCENKAKDYLLVFALQHITTRGTNGRTAELNTATNYCLNFVTLMHAMGI